MTNFRENQFLLFLVFYFYTERSCLFTLVQLKQEREFQAKLINEIKSMFCGCIVMKMDASYIQGIPDLLILYKDKWAALECKKFAGAKKQPNQQYYVELMNKMSFSRFINPENKEEILSELQQALEPRGAARFSRGK